MKKENDTAEAIHAHLESHQSLFLATLDQQKNPFSSYAPYAINIERNCLYLLLSDLSQHSLYLMANPQASILIADDESDTRQIYARNRLQFKVTAKYLQQDDEKQSCLEALQNKHGKIVEMLSQLPDFRAFELTPTQGRYVIGFGQTYISKLNSLIEGFELLTKDQL